MESLSKAKGLNDTVKLANGVEIPCLGYGTWKTPAGYICKTGIKTALECGYKLIDTATVYGNEHSIGEAIAESGVNREDLFITTKVWNTDQGYDNTLKAFDLSMEKLRLDYLDLYLIHWPIALDYKNRWQTTIKETWQAIEKLYKEGRVRAIGVSNFLERHLNYLMSVAEIKPMVDQIELHVGYIQSETVEFCQKNNIIIEAWSPVCKGKAFELSEVKQISERTGKTGAQVLIRWCLQRGFIPLPKSITPERIIENAKVFDFELTSDEMELLNAVDKIGRLGSHPDFCTF